MATVSKSGGLGVSAVYDANLLLAGELFATMTGTLLVDGRAFPLFGTVCRDGSRFWARWVCLHIFSADCVASVEGAAFGATHQSAGDAALGVLAAKFDGSCDWDA